MHHRAEGVHHAQCSGNTLPEVYILNEVSQVPIFHELYTHHQLQQRDKHKLTMTVKNTPTLLNLLTRRYVMELILLAELELFVLEISTI